ncbi:MAG: tetratricopeptide repeat protein, partial [Proteobacteria bacterium]|nr:tetratricopeptide repeat protein [Pseudomonadota bacterium]
QAFCDWVNWKTGVSLGNRCKKDMIPELTRVMESEGIIATINKYNELKETASDKYFVGEGLLNNFGYQLLRAGKIGEAIAIFRLNVEEYPDAWNVYDSLGEAYMENGDFELAIENYEKSIEINPNNTNGIEMLEKIRSKTNPISS